MRAAALMLTLGLPLPVTTIGAAANPDGSVIVFWTLPRDPTVVGVTVFRQRLDLFEPEVVFSLGLDTQIVDFSASVTGSYRYWVHTRNAFGELSIGVFAEVFTGAVVFIDDDDVDSWFVCWASASGGPSPWALGFGLALLALALTSGCRAARGAGAGRLEPRSATCGTPPATPACASSRSRGSSCPSPASPSSDPRERPSWSSGPSSR